MDLPHTWLKLLRWGVRSARTLWRSSASGKRRQPTVADCRMYSAATWPGFSWRLGAASLFNLGGRPRHFYLLSTIPCDARRLSALVDRITQKMLSELTKLAVASTAATVLIWLLSLMAPRCLSEHVGDLISFAAC